MIRDCSHSCKESSRSLQMTMATLSLLLASFLFISASATTQSNITDNPADHLVDVLTTNRTANNGSSLDSNAGLGCIALQYIKAYKGNCGVVEGPKAMKPADALFAETFAPNCGVDAKTLTPITGRLIGCATNYFSPAAAFSQILIKDEKNIENLNSKNHTEVGAAVSGTDGGPPYFWCVLFSNGQINNSFVSEGGVPKVETTGCFSGAHDVCNRAASGLSRANSLFFFAVTALVLVVL